MAKLLDAIDLESVGCNNRVGWNPTKATIMKDIIKAVAYHQGTREHHGVKKHLTLIAMIVASDEELVPEDNQEMILMGSANIISEMQTLDKFQPTYRLGQIGNAICNISNLTPDDLEPFGFDYDAWEIDED